MPTETRSRNTNTKPITPALSSNIRARPAFTPRLAGNGPASPASAPQRSLRQQTLSPVRNEEGRTQSLNSNITPRSGTRKSRIDTESPSTPDVAQRVQNSSAEAQDDATAATYGLGISSPSHTPTCSARPRSAELLSSLPTARRISGASTASQVKEEGKFFRADDVKPVSAQPRTAVSRSKTTSFVRENSPRLSPKKPAAEKKNGTESKFFYADNIATQPTKPARPTLATKLSATPSTQSLPILGSRPSPASSVRSPKSVLPGNSSSKPPSPSTTTSQTRFTDRRRSSSLNIRPVIPHSPKEHRKSLSVSSVSISPKQTDTPRKLEPAKDRETLVSDSAPSISPSTTSPRSTSFASTNTLATSTNSDNPRADTQPQMRSILHSRHARNSSETTAIQPVTQAQLEAAANARRERKVLDLEISNSSLLAINRTLEKELRKQNGELRRFRRLSRSGRLSLTPSHRIVSGASMSTLTTLDETDQDESQMTFSPGSSEDGLPDEDDLDDFSDEGSAFTESSDAVRRRARDEKRLLQDLQRHQQILIDSQRLTQSIQRCLHCTDELIKDGNKALAYQVEAEEVKLGGRVLSHDDEELSEVDFDEFSQFTNKPRQGLLSPTITNSTFEEASMWLNGLQSIDELNEPQPQDKAQILLHPRLTESPSPTLSPVILPEKDPVVLKELD